MLSFDEDVLAGLTRAVLSGNTRRVTAERQKLESLISQGALSKQQFLQYNHLTSHFNKLFNMLSEARAAADPHQSLQILADLLELEPKYLPALQARIDRLVEVSARAVNQDQYAQAFMFLDRAAATASSMVTHFPTAPAGYYARGTVLLTRGHLSRYQPGDPDTRALKQAADDFTKAVELMLGQDYPAEDISEALSQKARVFCLRSDYIEDRLSRLDELETGEFEKKRDELENKRDAALRKAISYFSRAIEVNPNNWEALSECGELLAAFDRTAEAISLLRQAVAKTPEESGPQEALARVLRSAIVSRKLNRDYIYEVVDLCLRVIDTNPLHNHIMSVLEFSLYDLLKANMADERALQAVDRVINRFSELLHVEDARMEASSQLFGFLTGILLRRLISMNEKIQQAINKLSPEYRERLIVLLGQAKG